MTVRLRFYGPLNDHVPTKLRQQTIGKRVPAGATVKDTIESLGVPHTEVALVVVNGDAADFEHSLSDGDRVAVYPRFERKELAPGVSLIPALEGEPRFVLDVHLGKLAAYLRMLGFDTSYRTCFHDADLARISAAENRILLTRDRGLLKYSAVRYGYWLRETDSRRQAAEVVNRFGLQAHIQPFSRCMACNGVLEQARREAVLARLPRRTAELHTEFKACPRCGRVYWKGSHYERMLRFIEQLAAIQP